MKIPFLSLFKKPIDSFSDEISTKFKTPFFTTYVIVWAIQNNLFVYNLFFNPKIEDKTNVLNNYFKLSEFSFYTNSFITILITFVLLILFYVFLNISRSITVYSEERVKLNLLNSLKSDSISSVDDLNIWKNKSFNLKQKNRELEDEINTLRSSNKYYKEKYEEREKKIKEIVKETDLTIKKIYKVISDYKYTETYLQSNENLKTILSEIESSVKTNVDSYEKYKNEPSFIVS